MRTSITTRLGAASMGAIAMAIGLAASALAQDVAGSVDIHGSSTVAPISNAVSEDFAALNPGFGYFVGEEGTGDGFSQYLCVDNADISDASRAITEGEIELCSQNGVEFVELKVGYDGLAVITSPENPIECLNHADLYAIFGPESSDITTWEDAGAFAAELGSSTVFPTGPIAITAPSTESGTYDSFVDLGLGDMIEARADSIEPIVVDGEEVIDRLRDPVPPYYVGSANDRVIIEGVAGSAELTGTIGFVGLAYATEAGDAVKIVAIDGGDGCVAPDTATVSAGSYSISRPLFIYPALNRLESNPAIAPFVDFYLSDEGLANVTERLYVALHPDDLEASRTAWAAASGR